LIAEDREAADPRDDCHSVVIDRYGGKAFEGAAVTMHDEQGFASADGHPIWYPMWKTICT
jgi:hypothetical protein